MKMARWLYSLVLLLVLHAGAMQAQTPCDSLIQTAIDASIAHDYERSLQLLQEARVMATEQKNAEQQFWILTNVGINYAELLNYSDALDAFMEAYKIAMSDLDKRHEMSILNNIAGLYMLDDKYDNAIEYYTLVYETVKETGDSLFIGGCAMNIVNASICASRPQLTETYLAVAENHLAGHPQELTRLATLRANYLLQRGNTRRALEVATQSMQQATELADPALQNDARLALVNIYREQGNYPAMIATIEQCLAAGVGQETRRDLYEMLSEAHTRMGNLADALVAKDSLIAVADSLYNIQGRKQWENSRIQFELLRREQEIAHYRTQNRNNRIFFALVLVIVVVLIWALINQTVKSRQQKKIIELELEHERQNQLILQNRLAEQQTKTLLEEERYRHEIELKDKELISKALIMANRNDLIYKIIDTIQKNDAIVKQHNTALNESIRQLQRMLDDNEEWEHFTTYFEQRNDSFIGALREQFPHLSAQEIRFLSLVYLNLSTKEIALLLNITPEYCKKKKQQIAKKMGLDNAKALYAYIARL